MPSHLCQDALEHSCKNLVCWRVQTINYKLPWARIRIGIGVRGTLRFGPWNYTKSFKQNQQTSVIILPTPKMHYYKGNASKFKGKNWVPSQGYPSSCSQHIAPDSPIQPVFLTHICGICWCISRVLSLGYPTFPFEKLHKITILYLHEVWFPQMGPI